MQPGGLSRRQYSRNTNQKLCLQDSETEENIEAEMKFEKKFKNQRSGRLIELNQNRGKNIFIRVKCYRTMVTHTDEFEVSSPSYYL